MEGQKLVDTEKGLALDSVYLKGYLSFTFP